MKNVLVGIDDSSNARAALRWALDHTDPRDQITALHVWHVPTAAGIEGAFVDPGLYEPGAVECAQTVAADVVQDAEADRVRVETACGHAPTVLIERGASCDLLVLGARGHGGFAGMLLGSVTNSVVHHARCPVVVVPATNHR